MFFNNYPYSDFHELNLDWLIAKMKELSIAFDEFAVVNQITFSGAWDITKQYKAWTLVDDGGMGYVSIKPVPAGIDISNNDYWRLIADYSVIIAGMEGRIISLENRMDTAENNISTNSDNINYLGVQLRRLRDKHVIFIGDSYADPNRGGYANGWATVAKEVIGLDNNHYHVYQKGGAGFIGAGQGVTFGNLANDAIADFSDEDAANITDIVIAGGCNDCDGTITEADLATAVGNITSQLHAKFTNAVIRIAAIGGFLKYGNTAFMPRVYNAYYNYYITQSYIKPILNAHLPMMITSSYDADGIHPVQAGVIRIGRLIGTAVIENNAYGDASFSHRCQITPESGLTLNGDNFDFIVNNNGIQVLLHKNLTVNGSVTVDAGLTVITLGSITNSLIANISGSTVSPEKAVICAPIEFYGHADTNAELILWYDAGSSELKVGLRIEGYSTGTPFSTPLTRIRPFNSKIFSIV